MLLIGESINIMSKRIGPAIKERDKKPIQDIAVLQVESGADMLDLNIGPARKQGDEVMEWVVKTVQEVVDVPLSLDTTNPAAMEAGLKVCKNRPLINSISNEPERIEKMLPLAKKYDVPFIGLLLSKEGIPRNADERAVVASEIVMKANEAGIENENIWIDPILFPVSADQKQIVEFFEFLKMLPELCPGCKSCCGLSNTSNGVPQALRSVVDRTLYTILETLGMYSAIVNVLNKDFMAEVKTNRILRNEVLYSHSWIEI
jgi:5-methyltetrahydrofolate corrinoid/iron sulfur protein methyltransferase